MFGITSQDGLHRRLTLRSTVLAHQIREVIALHSLVLSMGQSLLQNGLFQGEISGQLAPEKYSYRMRYGTSICCRQLALGRTSSSGHLPRLYCRRSPPAFERIYSSCAFWKFLKEFADLAFHSLSELFKCNDGGVFGAAF